MITPTTAKEAEALRLFQGLSKEARDRVLAEIRRVVEARRQEAGRRH